MYFKYNENSINLQTENRNRLLNLEYEFFIQNLKKQEFLKKKRNKEVLLFKLIQYKLFLKKRKQKKRELFNQSIFENNKNNQDLLNQENKQKSNLKQYIYALYPKFY